jgi:hypothetical protein
VQAQPIVEPEKPKPKAKSRPRPKINLDKKFQIMLSGEWKDYEKQEDGILKKAYLVGHPNCKFALRGQHYEYNFKKMKQINLGTNKEREIRPPPGFKPPKEALLPVGPMTVLTVKPGQAGTTVEIPDPNNKGKTIQVNVPSGAKPGQKMAVPLPQPGESIQDCQKKQKEYSTGAKLAMGTAGIAAVGGLALGGVILGDHLTGGTLGVSEAAADIVDAAPGAIEGAVEDAIDAAPGIAEDAVDWVEGDATDWVEGAVEDAGDWLGDAAEDTGDFIMSLF